MTSFDSITEPAAAWLLLSAHSSSIVHLSDPNKELGSSVVHSSLPFFHPSPGMDVALMLPTQAWQLSFLLPSKDLGKFFVLIFLLFLCYLRFFFKDEIRNTPGRHLHRLHIKNANTSFSWCNPLYIYIGVGVKDVLHFSWGKSE